ncbi:globin-like [Haemaphysalis longicornis]
MGQEWCKKKRPGQNDGGLSDEDKQAIRDTWKSFRLSHPDPGTDLFLTLLDKHPDFQALFRDFKGKPKEAIPQEPFFKKHCEAVGKLLDDVVETLDAPAMMADVVRTNALEHVSRDGVLPQHFQALWDLIGARIGESGQASPPAAPSWAKLLQMMAEMTVKVYESVGITGAAGTAATASQPSPPASTEAATPKPEAAPSKPEHGKSKSKSKPKNKSTTGGSEDTGTRSKK